MAATDNGDLVESLRSGKLAAVRASLRANRESGRSAAAIEAGRLAWQEALELLVQHGADVNAAWRGYRPLHALIQEAPHAENGAPTAARLACLDWLLAHGADPELLGAFPPMRALTTAALVGESSYVERLLRAGAVVDGFGAAALGDRRVVDKCLKKDTRFAAARDAGGLSALHCCAGSRMGARDAKCQRALLEIARSLIDGGADVNARVKGWSHELDVSYFAVNSGQAEVFALLLERGANAAAALPAAVWRGDFPMAELALRHGAAIDRAADEGKPLLNQMIRWGQIKQTFWLLQQGASPNIADEQGWTAVHQAASRGNERMLRAVLEAGGDRACRDPRGRTPLEIARLRRRSKIAAMLSDE